MMFVDRVRSTLTTTSFSTSRPSFRFRMTFGAIRTLTPTIRGTIVVAGGTYCLDCANLGLVLGVGHHYRIPHAYVTLDSSFMISQLERITLAAVTTAAAWLIAVLSLALLLGTSAR
jgi:hypothetical protein